MVKKLQQFINKTKSSKIIRLKTKEIEDTFAAYFQINIMKKSSLLLWFCLVFISLNFALGQISIYPSIDHPDCNNQNGRIQLYITGGDGSYSFNWNNYPSNNTSSLDDLSEGNYHVTVSDNSGLSSSQEIVLAKKSNLSLNLNPTIQYPSCHNGDGKVTLDVKGGSNSFTYSWVTEDGNEFSTSSEVSNLSANTRYTVTVTDANNNCFSKTQNFYLRQDASSNLALEYTKKSATCDENDGEIIVNVIGGNKPYIYSWESEFGGFVQGDSAQSTLLANGIYHVTVTDPDNSCISGSATISLSETPKSTLKIDYTKIDPTCQENDGEITLHVTGGSGEYIYSWNNFPEIDNEKITGLSENSTHIVTVTDREKSCISSSASIKLKEKPKSSLQVNYSKENPSCLGGDGMISLDVSGGTEPYRFVWSDQAETIEGQASRYNLSEKTTYFVKVYDGLDACKSTELSIALREKEEESSMDIECHFTNPDATGNGQINVISPSELDGNYSYEWTNTSNVVLGETRELTNCSKTTWYYLKVKDIDNPCVVGKQKFYLWDKSTESFNVDLDITQATDCSTGAIKIKSMGGQAPHNVLWTWPQNQSNDLEISGLTPGKVTLTITDNNNQIFQKKIQIVQNESKKLKLDIINVFPSNECNTNSGKATAQISGGSGNYTVNWYVGSALYGEGKVMSNLAKNTYKVTVTDNTNPCLKAEGYVRIEETPKRKLNIDLVSIGASSECTGIDDGHIEVNVTGGSEEFDYIWKKGNTIIDGNDFKIEGLSAGLYSVQVEDRDSCWAGDRSFQVDIAKEQKLSIDLISMRQANQCTGLNSNGLLEVLATGGSDNITYEWQKSGQIISSTEKAEDLTSGTYTVTATDQSQTCTSGTETFKIDAIKDIALDIDVIENTPTVEDQFSGIVEVLADGGSGEYTYTWNDANNTQGSRIEYIGSGNIDVTANDENNACASATKTIFVNHQQSSDFIIEASIIEFTDCDNPDGGVDISIIGGVGPFKTMWTSISGSELSDDSSEDLNNVEPGIYQLMVTDEFSNITETKYYEVEGSCFECPSEIHSGFAVTNNTGCVFGEGGGEIEIVPATNVDLDDYTINWSYYYNPNDPNIKLAEGNKIENLEVGRHFYEVTYSHNQYPTCSGSLNKNSFISRECDEPYSLNISIDECANNRNGIAYINVPNSQGYHSLLVAGGGISSFSHHYLPTETLAVNLNGSENYYFKVVLFRESTESLIVEKEIFTDACCNLKIAEHNSNNAKSCTSNDGSIELTAINNVSFPINVSVAGNNETTEYSFSDYPVVIDNLTSGDYDVTVSNEAGTCSDNTSITVNYDNKLEIVAFDSEEDWDGCGPLSLQMVCFESLNYDLQAYKLNENGSDGESYLDYNMAPINEDGTFTITWPNGFTEGDYRLRIIERNPALNYVDVYVHASGCSVCPENPISGFDFTNLNSCEANSLDGSITPLFDSPEISDQFNFDWNYSIVDEETDGELELFSSTDNTLSGLKTGFYRYNLTITHKTIEDCSFTYTGEGHIKRNCNEQVDISYVLSDCSDPSKRTLEFNANNVGGYHKMMITKDGEELVATSVVDTENPSFLNTSVDSPGLYILTVNYYSTGEELIKTVSESVLVEACCLIEIAEFNSNNAKSCTANDGSIELTTINNITFPMNVSVTGNNEAIEYQFTDYPVVIHNLSSGDYNVTVSNEDGTCSDNTIITVDHENTLEMIAFDSEEDWDGCGKIKLQMVCFGQYNGFGLKKERLDENNQVIESENRRYKIIEEDGTFEISWSGGFKPGKHKITMEEKKSEWVTNYRSTEVTINASGCFNCPSNAISNFETTNVKSCQGPEFDGTITPVFEADFDPTLYDFAWTYKYEVNGEFSEIVEASTPVLEGLKSGKVIYELSITTDQDPECSFNYSGEAFIHRACEDPISVETNVLSCFDGNSQTLEVSVPNAGGTQILSITDENGIVTHQNAFEPGEIFAANINASGTYTLNIQYYSNNVEYGVLDNYNQEIIVEDCCTMIIGNAEVEPYSCINQQGHITINLSEEGVGPYEVKWKGNITAEESATFDEAPFEITVSSVDDFHVMINDLGKTNCEATVDVSVTEAPIPTCAFLKDDFGKAVYSVDKCTGQLSFTTECGAREAQYRISKTDESGHFNIHTMGVNDQGATTTLPLLEGQNQELIGDYKVELFTTCGDAIETINFSIDQQDMLDCSGGCVYELSTVEEVKCGSNDAFTVELNVNEYATLNSGIIGLDFTIKYPGFRLASQPRAGSVVQAGGNPILAYNEELGRVHISIAYEGNGQLVNQLDDRNVVSFRLTPNEPTIFDNQLGEKSIFVEYDENNDNSGILEAYLISEKSECAREATLQVIPNTSLFGYIETVELSNEGIDPYNEQLHDVNIMTSSELGGNSPLEVPFSEIFTSSDYYGAFGKNVENAKSYSLDRHNVSPSEAEGVFTAYDAALMFDLTTFNYQNDANYHALSLMSADVNQNGKVRSNDVTILQQRAARLITEFPQAWNYSVDGTNPNANDPNLYHSGNSYDWIFLTEDLLNHKDYQNAHDYPLTAEHMVDETVSLTWRDNVPKSNFSIEIVQNENECSSINETNFEAILLGDLDGSWNKLNHRNLNISDYEVEIHLNNGFEENGSYFVPVKVLGDDNLRSLDLRLINNSISFNGIRETPEISDFNLSTVTNIQDSELIVSSFGMNGKAESGKFWFLLELSSNTLQSEDFVLSNAYVNGQKSNVSYIEDEVALSNEDINKPNFSVYPNPSSGIVNLNLSSEVNNKTLEIYDVLGSLVKSISVNGKSALVDLSELSGGIYYLQMSTDELQIMEKILIKK